jgi:hypothetical protein
MKKLIILIVGILISVSAISQNISKPIIIKDSLGITLIAFNEKQVDIIIKTMKDAEFSNKVIVELQKKIKLENDRYNLTKNENDTLKKNIQTYIEIKLNLEQQISIKTKIIDELNKNIIDYNKIEENLNKEILIYKERIKTKNRKIITLLTTNIITLTILILLIY